MQLSIPICHVYSPIDRIAEKKKLEYVDKIVVWTTRGISKKMVPCDWVQDSQQKGAYETGFG